MSPLMISSLGTGIACWIWGFAAPMFGLISFVGFAGTTTYFFAGDMNDGYKKIPKCFLQNLFGIIYALVAIWVATKNNSLLINSFMTGLISFLMVYQGKVIPYLDWPPASFIACFTTFAASEVPNGLRLVLPSIIAGYIVALGCDYIARAINKAIK